MPAGKASHEMVCTGKGYKPSHTHSPPGSHDTKEKRAARAAKKDMDASGSLILCAKGCGRKLRPAGKPHHEKYCTGPGYTPGYSAARRVERRIEGSVAHYKVTYAPKAGVEMAYEMFQDDPLMFSIMVHLMSARAGYDVVTNLEAAKGMIDLKIKEVSKP
jgi:hypothetical protein